MNGELTFEDARREFKKLEEKVRVHHIDSENVATEIAYNIRDAIFFHDNYVPPYFSHRTIMEDINLCGENGRLIDEAIELYPRIEPYIEFNEL